MTLQHLRAALRRTVREIDEHWHLGPSAPDPGQDGVVVCESEELGEPLYLACRENPIVLVAGQAPRVEDEATVVSA